MSEERVPLQGESAAADSHKLAKDTDPMARLASAPREYGEYGGVNPSIEMSSTFTVMEASTLDEVFKGKPGTQGIPQWQKDSGLSAGSCYLYARSFSPSVLSLARGLAALEGTEGAYCTASGMAAISATLLALCDTGDHIVASRALYGGTHALLKHFLPAKCGIRVTFVDVSQPAAVEAAIEDRTKVVFTEAVANPTLQVANLPALARAAHDYGCTFVVDNTFTPLSISPARWGADVVLHSLTKFISGASDVVAGAVCASQRFINSLMDLQRGPVMLLGPTLDALTASALLRRLPTLGLRIAEHSRRAARFAAALHARGARVLYPGLPGHAGHELMQRLMNRGYGFGGVMCVDMGSRAAAGAFVEALQNKHAFGLMAVSLGYYDTLMSVSAFSTSSELTEGELAAAGVTPGLVRLSIGYTGSCEDRQAQIEAAYQSVSELHKPENGVNGSADATSQ